MICAMSLLTNFFKQKAAVRPQKIGLKAAAIVHVKYEYSIQYKQEDKKYLRLFWVNHSGMNTIYKKEACATYGLRYLAYK